MRARYSLRIILAAVLIVLAITSIALPVQAQGTKLKYGQSVKGEIDDTEEGRSQIYYFSGKKGDKITITMTGTSGDLKPLISLGFFDKDNKANRLAGSDKANGKVATLSNIALPATQEYYIL